MRLSDLFGPARLRLPAFAPEGGAGDPPPAAGAGDPPPPAANPPASDPPPANPPASGAKWWEALPEQQRAYLTPKGLTVDDPMQALPRLIDIASNAEKRIGKGLDQIIEKPGKDVPVQKWLRDNAAALGLPDKEDAYTATPPEDWPKDMAWDGAFEAKARKIAFENGVAPEAHKAYVAAFADQMKSLAAAADAGLKQANDAMMADLQKDFGAQTPAVIQNAKRAAEWMATQAGMGAEELERVSAVLAEKTGDAGVIRMLHAVGKALGEDSGIAMGRGGPLTMTPADARAELAALRGPGGEYYNAVQKRDLGAKERLQPRIDQLTKIAAG